MFDASLVAKGVEALCIRCKICEVETNGYPSGGDDLEPSTEIESRCQDVFFTDSEGGFTGQARVINTERIMASLSDHPTVKRFWEKAEATAVKPGSAILDAQWLPQLCLDAGADDVRFVDVDGPELGNEGADIVRFFQPTKALISLVTSAC